MIHRKTLLYLIALGLCLFIGITDGQDWLVGGYVSSFGPYDGDPSIAGLKRWLDYPVPTYTLYGMNGSEYYLPYGAYSSYPAAYYPTPGWTPLYGAGWQAYQKNWAKTLDYAQTRSSIRVYPRQPIPPLTYAPAQQPTTAYTTAPPEITQPAVAQPAVAQPAVAQPAVTQPAVAQPGAATAGDSTAIIVSQSMRGYQVYLDGVYIGTEGTGTDPLDGIFSFKVVGNQNHEIRVYDGQFNDSKTIFFYKGSTRTINVAPGNAIWV